MQQLVPDTRDRRSVWVVGAAAALLLVVLGVAQTGTGADLTRGLGLSPAIQPYTEIFIDPANALPPALPLGATLPVPVTFTLGNGSEDAQSYRWSVTETTAQGPRVLATGTTDVGPNTRRDRTVAVPVACTDPEVELAIGVEGTPQPVTHHIQCLVPRR